MLINSSKIEYALKLMTDDYNSPTLAKELFWTCFPIIDFHLWTLNSFVLRLLKDISRLDDTLSLVRKSLFSS